MKRILFVLGVLALLVSIQLYAVHGRALRSTKTEENVAVPGREGEGEGGADDKAVPVGVHSFKRMAFRLASGPSRKGPGH
ncbi:hypothetical protein like AT5G43064 [Hibiscus trionum]|uniref:Uncharacterized protein n=1 Tax=Hibiscus trionum TaxID=183268 RepID=A0A9W7M045_HIBTR|nr:hypothetical protein like AT5G43064 [Hibiscus trionum]